MCKQCEKKPVYEFTNQRKLCANCFVRWFQKKVLYTMRKFEMIKSGDIIGYFGTQGCTPKNIQKNIFTKGIVGFEKGNTFRDVVLEDVLKMFAEKAPVELKKIPASQIDIIDNKKVSKIAIAQTTDLASYEIVDSLVNKNLKKVLPTDKKIIKPLYLFLDEEVLLYAKLRELKYREVKVKKDKLSVFIDELEIKHPEIKRAVVNGLLEMD